MATPMPSSVSWPLGSVAWHPAPTNDYHTRNSVKRPLLTRTACTGTMHRP